MQVSESHEIESDTGSEEGSSCESGDDVWYEGSDGNSSDGDGQDLLSGVEALDISHDQYFMSHETNENPKVDCTQTECVDMEITSELEEQTFELNVPVMSVDHVQDSMEGSERASPNIQLLHDNYLEHTSLSNANKEMRLVKENKFVSCTCKITELFELCMDRDCNMPIVQLKEKYIGCVLEVRWLCQASHRGDWQSSKIVNRVYVNNIQAASALLFTGNNYVKLSLFAKCFQLAFISESTFHVYQKNYLAPQIHSLWNEMQAQLFENLKDQPVIVSGDGQMDSPGFSVKTCTYTLMHAELDYVLHVEVVDVRHSQLKSTVMEKVGCQRALDFLMARVNVVELVSDASSQIIKMLGKYNLC